MIETEITTGILYVFPPEQTFELAVLDGCVNGNFMVGNSISNYFADALQPIKFVTADIIDPEFDKVLIRVGTDLDGGGGGAGRPVKVGNEEEKIVIEERSRVDTLRAGFEKMIAEKKAEAKKKEEGGNEPQAPIVPLCYPYGPSKEFNFNKNVVVGDECDNLPTEQQEISYTLLEQPEFFKVPHSDLEELKLVELIQVCNDTAHPNQNGGSIPVEYKRYRYDYTTNSFKISWVLEPYKGIDGYVHYYFKNQQSNQSTPLLFDFVTGVCYTKINKPWLTLIENISDVDEPSKIPSSDDDQAFSDFCGHLCLPNVRATYVLVEIIQIHEEEHMNDFEEIISRGFPKLVQEIEKYRDFCQSYNETIRQTAEKAIYDMVETFIKKVIKDFQSKSGEPNSKTELDNERKIQGRPSITNRIEDYKNALKNRFSSLEEKVCEKCSYEEQN